MERMTKTKNKKVKKNRQTEKEGNNWKTDGREKKIVMEGILKKWKKGKKQDGKKEWKTKTTEIKETKKEGKKEGVRERMEERVNINVKKVKKKSLKTMEGKQERK